MLTSRRWSWADTSYRPRGRAVLALLSLLGTTGLAAAAESTAKPSAKAPPPAQEVPSLAARFRALSEQARDLEYPALLDRLTIKPAAARLSFDASKARYYPEVERALGLVAGEAETFKRHGFAMVDHGTKLSMGKAYLEIYRADLPVFVSADSILHALHRSYDEILRQLEEQVLFANLDLALDRIQVAVCELPKTSPALKHSLVDVSVLLAVARRLLEPGKTNEATSPTHRPSCEDAKTVAAILKKVAAQIDDAPEGPGTPLWGRRAIVDWSQFKPRGHYVKSPRLQAYFQAMMWLGRADVAWKPALDRELNDAALLVLLVGQTEQSARLGEMSRLIDFLVGRADSLGPDGMQVALKAAGIATKEDLRARGALARLRAEVSKRPEAQQQIRSEHVESPSSTPTEVPLPTAFQLFGQRFVMDSFLLSKMVFDSIRFRESKPKRFMPSGLDVMAALGSDQAILELEPELRRWNYAANLWAARALLDGLPEAAWHENVYTRWLGALRILHRPPTNKFFPEVMRTAAWQRKQLQTTLASWAELRHDTILYAKQSKTAYAICEYPEGYVEPYPAFYAALADLARQAMRLFAGPVLGTATPKGGVGSHWSTAVKVEAFFGRFAKTMDKLATIASKELSATPFDADDKQFLKHVIEQKLSVGCAPTVYFTGWYTQLFFDDPLKREPTVADVHADPNSGTVLEAGAGDVRYLAIAIDNEQHRAVYVGPVASYYEFTSGTRLTDAEWEPRIADTPIPPFVKDFVGAPVPRQMKAPGKEQQP